MRQLAKQTASHRCAVKKLQKTMPGGVRSSDWLPLVPCPPTLHTILNLHGSSYITDYNHGLRCGALAVDAAHGTSRELKVRQYGEGVEAE